MVANAAAVDAAALGNATKLFQAFGERYHEQLLEEQHIFPIVRKAGADGDLIDTLLQTARSRPRDYGLHTRSNENGPDWNCGFRAFGPNADRLLAHVRAARRA